MACFDVTSLLYALEWREASRFFLSASLPRSRASLSHSCSQHNNMPRLSAEAKHHILLEYQPHSTSHSFAALARKHNIVGGERTVRRWHQRWNRSVASLQEKKRSGRPRLLSRAQVSRYVRAPILAANRAHRAIHYSTLLPSVQAKSHTAVSLRSLRRYGQQELGVKQKHSKKRTADESECTDTREMEWARVCVEQHAYFSL
jgi:transposase